MYKLISYRDLRSKGITYSRTQLWRKMKAGTFPRPIKVGEQRVAWVEREVDDWIAERIAERDANEAH